MGQYTLYGIGGPQYLTQDTVPGQLHPFTASFRCGLGTERH